MERTLSNGSSEEFDDAVSDPRAPIGECLSKCGDDVSVKYLVLKPLWEYFGVNILLSHENYGVHLELWQQ